MDAFETASARWAEDRAEHARFNNPWGSGYDRGPDDEDYGPQNAHEELAWGCPGCPLEVSCRNRLQLY